PPITNTLDIALTDGAIVVLSRTGEVSLIDRTGTTQWRHERAAVPGSTVYGKRLAVNLLARLVVSYGPVAEVMRLEDGAPVIALRSAAPITAAAFDRDGRRLATGDATGEIRVWALPGGGPIATCAGHADRIEQLAFSADGAMLVSASDDRDV